MYVWSTDVGYYSKPLHPAKNVGTKVIPSVTRGWYYTGKETCITLKVNQCYDKSCFEVNANVAECNTKPHGQQRITAPADKDGFPTVVCDQPCIKEF